MRCAVDEASGGKFLSVRKLKDIFLRADGSILPVSFALACLALLLYGRTLGFELIWDDHKLFEAHGSPAAGPLGALFSEPFLIGSGRYYRPVVMASYWAQRLVSGPSAIAFHAFQVLLYALSVLIFHALARSLLDAFGRTSRGSRNAVAALAAVLFAAHPAHAETVAFVSARTDLLMGLFAMLSVWASLLFLRCRTPSRGTVLWPATAGLALFAALLCKESAAAAPLIVTLIFLAAGEYRRQARRFVLLFAVFAAVGAAYGALRAAAIGSVTPAGLEIGSVTDILAVCGRNAELLFVPVRLRVIHTLPDSGVARTALAAAGALALVACLFALLRIRRNPLPGVAAVWMLLATLPTMGIIRISAAATAERFLFLSSGGAALLLAAAAWWCIARAPRLKSITVFAAAAVCVLFSGRCIARQGVYSSDAVLYQQIITEEPELVTGYEGLGELLLKQEKYNEAILHLERAVALLATTPLVGTTPGKSPGYLGAAYLRVGRVAEAISLLERAYEAFREPELLVDLGHAYLAAGRYIEAEKILSEAVLSDGGLAEAHLNLGIAVSRQKRYGDALVHLETAVSLRPDDPDFLYNLGNGYARAGRLDEAASTYRKALHYAPDHGDAQSNLEVVIRALEAR